MVGNLVKFNYLCSMEGKRLKYPIGSQDFAWIRENGYVYIDKTDLVYDLIDTAKYLFLARPRRFGKSLLLSTLRYYFEGRKDLFEGLKIMDLEREWKRYPVLHLSLGNINAAKIESLQINIERQFKIWEEDYDIKDKEEDLSSRLATIIRRAYEKTGERVVVLIDEYDNPLINTIHNREIHESHRNMLKSIYSNLKDMDEYIRFAMLTGVSRFSKTTIFSGLNNIFDITFHNNYSAICGFTEKEICEVLWPGIEALAEEEGISPQEAMTILKEEYDGYHFTERMIDVYNPFSLLNSLANSKIKNYWMQTGTPEFLARMLSTSTKSFSNIFSSEATEQSLAENDTVFSSPVSLLYQTGYLTIKDYNKEKKRFLLGVPNREVDSNLFPFLLGRFIGEDTFSAEDGAEVIKRYILEGDPEEFLPMLQAFLAPTPYSVFPEKPKELDFEHMLYLMFRTMGLKVTAEKPISFGRTDLEIETEHFLYIFELKVDRTPEEAVEQILKKEYTLPHKYDNRKLFKIGINFSSEKRNIDGWKVLES